MCLTGVGHISGPDDSYHHKRGAEQVVRERHLQRGLPQSGPGAGQYCLISIYKGKGQSCSLHVTDIAGKTLGSYSGKNWLSLS